MSDSGDSGVSSLPGVDKGAGEEETKAEIVPTLGVGTEQEQHDTPVPLPADHEDDELLPPAIEGDTADLTDTNPITESKETKPNTTEERLDVSDDDSVDDYAERLRYKYEDLEKRVQLAPKRLKQHYQYTNILEERISFLEERVSLFDKKLQKIDAPPTPIEDPPPAPSDEAAKLKPTLDPTLTFQSWREFKDPFLVPTHIIDVLVGEIETPKTERSRRKKALRNISWSREDGPLDSSDYLPINEADSDSQRILSNRVTALKGNQLPERIRFNQVSILRLFNKYLGLKHEAVPDNVLLRPFKPLLQNLDEVKYLLSGVSGFVHAIITQRESPGSDETKVPTTEVATDSTENAVHDDKTTEPGAPDSISQDEWEKVLKEFELFHCSECTKTFATDWPTETAMKQVFDCIQGLLDEYLLPVHTTFRDRKVDHAEFRDLWHMFQIGDIVMAKSTANDLVGSNPLGMKVLMTSGGRRVISSVLPPMPYSPSAKDTALLLSAQSTVGPIGGINPFCIDAYFLDYDGTRLVPVRKRFIVPPYAGQRKISDLDIFPIEYSKKSAQLLEERGRKFVGLVTANSTPYVNCTGMDLHTREELNDKIIVDMKGYFNTSYDDMPDYDPPGSLDVSETNDCPQGLDCIYVGTSSCYHRSMSIINDQASDMLIYSEYIEDRPEFNSIQATHEAKAWLPDFTICHYRIYAYKPRSREWVQVNVQNIDETVDKDPGKSFELLVLPDDHRQILESQVREHFRKRGLHAPGAHTSRDMDLVKGKGQGLIILLHGAPGVGKTCTAECIAELVEKPLYPLTCGDLGSTAEDVEKNLKRHFTLASSWDCVMLLDEADVFLARRRSEDLHRNSIVSVFLRMLEYYKGLLFLTTNRVGSFDEAFKSRVHISLFYENFDKDTTLKVWKTFIQQATEKLESEGRKNVNIDAPGIERFARKHWERNPRARWNGRQIRNAFLTAVAMAEFNSRDNSKENNNKDVTIDIGPKQFKKIAKTAKEFDEYMTETMGDTYDGKASRTNMRKTEKAGYESSRRSKKSKKNEDTSDSSDSSTAEKKDKKKSKKKKAKDAAKSDSSSSGSE